MPPNSGFGGGRLGVGVGVEGVAGELGEVVDVRPRDLARRRGDGVADPHLGEALAERVHAVVAALRAGRPAAGDRGHQVGRGLDGGALHVAEHRADAAELLAAAGPAGTAVDQHRQRRPVAGRLRGVVAVEHVDPAVPRRDAEHDGPGDVGVVGDDRGDQRALAAGRQVDGLVDASRRPSTVLTGPNGSTSCGSTAPRWARSSTGPRKAPRSGSPSTRSTVVRVAVHQVGRGAQRLDRLADLLALVEARQRAHPDVGVRRRTDGDLRQPVGQRLDDGVDHRRPARSRAGWPCTSARP